MDEDQCGFVKEDGTTCQARKIHGSDYCFFHDPARAGERAVARRNGGRRGRAVVLAPDTPACMVKDAGQVIDLLGQTINQVRTGALDPRIGNCMGYLAGIILKAVELSSLEERLTALESVIRNQKHPRHLFDDDPGELTISVKALPEPGEVQA